MYLQTGAAAATILALCLVYIAWSIWRSEYLQKSVSPNYHWRLGEAAGNHSVDFVVRNSLVSLNFTFENQSPFQLDVVIPHWFFVEGWPTPLRDPTVENDLTTYHQRTHELGNAYMRNEDNEDVDALKDFFNGWRRGVVFELGAMDGIEKSVSRPFEKFFDWRSIVFEADLSLASAMRTNRPDALSINMAACGAPTDLHWSASEYINKGGAHIKTIGAIVEFSELPFLWRFHKHIMKDANTVDEGKVKKLPTVRCMPLSPVLEKLNLRHINLFVLDCEGCEMAVLETLDFSKLTMDVLIVETSRGGGVHSKDRAVEIMQAAKGKETYEFYAQRGRNSWFVRRAFLNSIRGV